MSGPRNCCGHAPFVVCEVSCRAWAERYPTVCRLGRLDGCAPSESLPVRVPRSGEVAGFDVLSILRPKDRGRKMEELAAVGSTTVNFRRSRQNASESRSKAGPAPVLVWRCAVHDRVPPARWPRRDSDARLQSAGPRLLPATAGAEDRGPAP